jgi:hypothetical protein
MTTQGYGYVVRGDDVWYYTGVTSVTSDESNIGFILTNARTGEYKYYPVIGAEEYSAMGAAEGEVQETEYVASFPSLINVESEPTYIMVLKDAQGLVKLYALVNVQNYSIVATGTSQTAAKQAYLEELYKRGVIEEEDLPAPEAKTADVTVTAVRLATVGGETVVYITAADGVVYRGALTADESLILVTEGMTRAEADALSIRDGVCFQNGNVLITNENGKVQLHYSDGNLGAAQRTAIGQRADGTMLLLVTDGRSAASIGASKNDIIDFMVSQGAVVAGMLDGGTSSLMYYDNYIQRYNIDPTTLDEYQLKGIVNKYKAFIPPRSLPTFFVVAKEGEE